MEAAKSCAVARGFDWPSCAWADGEAKRDGIAPATAAVETMPKRLRRVMFEDMWGALLFGHRHSTLGFERDARLGGRFVRELFYVVKLVA
jgi:hypothetical protein